MKRLLPTTLLLLTLMMSAESISAKTNLAYVDATTLTIINKAQDDGLAFKRLDATKYDATKAAARYFGYGTGLAIAFTTDSREIHARWTTSSKRYSNNMSPILHSGMDLYIRVDGEWVFAGAARPKTADNEHKYAIVRRMEEGVKECLLYLPMFNGLTSLEIGVEEYASIKPMASPFKHKILFIGSSLTHGASASRPGSTYVARMGRMLNAEAINVGTSGVCRMEEFFADIACDTKADAYIFDTFSNSNAKIINERLFHFVERIATAHPDKPLIFLQTIKRETGNFDLHFRKVNDDQRAAAVRGMEVMCKKYKNVYFINPGFTTGDDHVGTIDGTHLNDLGVQYTLDVIMPKVRKILKKYGIK